MGHSVHQSRICSVQRIWQEIAPEALQSHPQYPGGLLGSSPAPQTRYLGDPQDCPDLQWILADLELPMVNPEGFHSLEPVCEACVTVCRMS